LEASETKARSTYIGPEELRQEGLTRIRHQLIKDMPKSLKKAAAAGGRKRVGDFFQEYREGNPQGRSARILPSLK